MNTAKIKSKMSHDIPKRERAWYEKNMKEEYKSGK